MGNNVGALSGQYGYTNQTEIKEAMKETGYTKFGKGGKRTESIFGEGALQAGATKEEFIDRIQEIGFSSDIANACWEVLNYNTEGDSADIIDEEELNQLLLMYGSDVHGERGDEIDEITVGSLYTMLNQPRNVDTSSVLNTSSSTTTTTTSGTTQSTSAATTNDESEPEVNERLVGIMTRFEEDFNELMNSGDVTFEKVIRFANSYGFDEFCETKPTTAEEIQYRSKFVNMAIDLFSSAGSAQDVSDLNNSTNIMDLIYTSFEDNDLREQKLQDLFSTVSNLELDSSESDVDWGKYDMTQSLEQLLNGEYTNADIQNLFSEKGGVENVISEIMKLDSSQQRKYLDALMNSLLNVEEVEANDPADPNNEVSPEGSGESETDNAYVRPATDDTPLSDTSAIYFADKINGGLPFQILDCSALQDVLNNQNLSQEDIIKIWSKYSEKYDENLLENANMTLNVAAKNQAIEELTDIAIEQAKAGNAEAISLLANELKASCKNMKFTPDHFMSYFFENIDTETLALITQEYSQLNNGASLASDIEGFIAFGKVADYAKQVDEAMSIL